MPNRKTIEHLTREQVAQFLPQAIEKSLESYRTFMNADISSDHKDFSDHHKAAKVAIAHIELLIKLARWADLPDATIEGQEKANVLTECLVKAEAEWTSYVESELNQFAEGEEENKD